MHRLISEDSIKMTLIQPISPFIHIIMPFILLYIA